MRDGDDHVRVLGHDHLVGDPGEPALAAGTAGWFRLYSSDTNDSGAIISGAPYYPRVDGSCGVGSGDLQLGTVTIGVGSPNTIDTFRFTAPNA